MNPFHTLLDPHYNVCSWSTILLSLGFIPSYPYFRTTWSQREDKGIQRPHHAVTSTKQGDIEQTSIASYKVSTMIVFLIELGVLYTHTYGYITYTWNLTALKGLEKQNIPIWVYQFLQI